MQRYNVELVGETPLIMHQNAILWRDTLKAWQTDPSNKGKSVAGDDRTPSWSWLGAVYGDQGKVVIPSDNLMKCMNEASAQLILKGNTTYKKLAASQVVVDQASWPLGANIDYDKLRDECLAVGDLDFAGQVKIAEKYGVLLFVKSVSVNGNKHIRIRPRFDKWSCKGTVTVLDEELIPDATFRQILELAGRVIGLCEWRASSPKSPGPFGKFSVKVSEVK